MGESADGSIAAQGALDQTENAEGASPRGFFSRIFGALGGGDSDGEGQDAKALGLGSAGLTGGRGLAALSRIRVDDIAIPTSEITAVPDTISQADLVATFREHGFSRMPVYKGSPDHPLGLIHLKDLALHCGFGQGEAGFDLRALLRPLLYVPPSMTLGMLLQKMQADRIHMALVIDEYGGLDGLVTIEDVIEEVIGEIDDEHDEAEEAKLWLQEKPGQWLVQARAPLDAVEAAIGRRLADDDEGDEVDTVGGLVFMLTGRVPKRGALVAARDGAEFEVIDADRRRIKRLRLRLPESLS